MTTPAKLPFSASIRPRVRANGTVAHDVRYRTQHREGGAA